MADDDPLLPNWAGAQAVLRVAVERLFSNCPRYIHRMQRVETSFYVPSEGVPTPEPAWKRFDPLPTCCRSGHRRCPRALCTMVRALRLKTAWCDGTAHIVMAPLEFMERPVPLWSRPRVHCRMTAKALDLTDQRPVGIALRRPATRIRRSDSVNRFSGAAEPTLGFGGAGPYLGIPNPLLPGVTRAASQPINFPQPGDT